MAICCSKRSCHDMFAGENGLVEKFMLAIFDLVPDSTCDRKDCNEKEFNAAQVRSLPWSPAIASMSIG